MKINLDDNKTSAQAVTNICYNEETRNLNFRITCENLEDFKECVRIINRYNDFDHKIINDMVEVYANFKKYLNEGNPNNGGSLLVFDIGREFSPVMYIKYFTYRIGGKELKYQTKEGEVRNFTTEEFDKNMKALASTTKADECDCYREVLKINEDGTPEYTGWYVCRLWWD